MDRLVARLTEPRTATLIILFVATATIGTALFSQHVLGYVPCKLCLHQRWPYYVAIPIALALVLAPVPDGVRRAGLGLLAPIFLVGAALGAYHAGVEWGFWLGPNDCGGAPPPAPSGLDDFRKQLEGVRVVSCTEAAFRFLGLSMAGWNVVVSLGLAALAAAAAVAHPIIPARRPAKLIDPL
ncbi:MAG TPA: disulfide bond formation protein B [Beijerinckiaceae bacterium]|jgi:disulfide bond formation protein DsbB